MIEILKRGAALLALCASCVALNGCLISSFVSETGALTTASVTVTLNGPAPCTVNTTNDSTNCKPVIQVGSPPLGQTYQVDITLLDYASPLTLYDPVIVQVPASMSNFAGSISIGPPPIASGTPLSIQSGLTSIPIDANTTLVAEPGMQFLIIDFSAPANMPSGSYTLNLQFSGTASSIKVVFAGKVTVGGNTYYPPIFPCVTSMAQVPPISVPATVASVLPILLSLQGCVGKQYSLGAPAGPGPNVDQQGLTGSWYNAVTSGQGFEFEFFVDLVAAGTAYLQGAWFTFDTTAGADDRQRWYTFSGNAQSGQASIPVTIYQNSGGTFGAPPITHAVAVGTGTLTLTSCTDGTFSYMFNDGRSGTIPLTRLTKNVTCVASGTPMPNADFGFTGNWYDAMMSGQGFVIEVNPASATLFFTWYTYAVNGQAAGAAGQRWYTGQASFMPGMRTIAATLYETTGGAFNQAAPAAQTAIVGTATITFTNCGTATITYNFTAGSNAGQSGSIPLGRVGPIPAGCGP